MSFSLYSANYNQHKINAVIRNLGNAKDTVQKMLLAFANSVKSGNGNQITAVLHRLGEIDSNNVLQLNADGQQIALFMRDHLPIKWDKKANKITVNNPRRRCSLIFRPAMKFQYWLSL